MTFSISDFRGQLKGDGARPNIFQVVMNKPAVLQIGNVPQQTSYMVRAASIPATQMGRIEVPYFGLKAKVGGDRTFDDWNVAVINDEDYAIRKLFEGWIDAVASPTGESQSRRTLGATASPLSYVTDATVIHFGKAGDVIAEYKFYNMFPTYVSAMELDWEANDQIQNFQVNFSYDWFKRL